MSRRAKIITALVLIVATIVIVVTVVIVAAILFLRQSGDTQAIGTATAVGVPTGPSTTKSIGPEGGSLTSPDGRISVKVPPNAVAAAVDFGVQPITNLGPGGVGSAYRLEPSGQKFAKPIKVSFRYDTEGFKDEMPESFAVAYQDPTGVWQALKTANIDRSSKTLTVSTTHFTDWSLWTIRLDPEKVTVHVGEKIMIRPTQCLKPQSMYERLQGLLGNTPCNGLWPSNSTWSVKLGTVSPVLGGALYTAPARRPSPNVDTVRFVYHLRELPNGQNDARECVITIIGNSYRASGNAGGSTAFSGVICDLEKRFSLKTTNPFLPWFDFVPSSPNGGTWKFVTRKGITGGGAGEYTLEGPDMQRTGILMSGNSTGCIPYGCRSGGGEMRIILTPLEGNECDGQ